MAVPSVTRRPTVIIGFRVTIETSRQYYPNGQQWRITEEALETIDLHLNTSWNYRREGHSLCHSLAPALTTRNPKISAAHKMITSLTSYNQDRIRVLVIQDSFHSQYILSSISGTSKKQPNNMKLIFLLTDSTWYRSSCLYWSASTTGSFRSRQRGENGSHFLLNICSASNIHIFARRRVMKCTLSGQKQDTNLWQYFLCNAMKRMLFPN